MRRVISIGAVGAALLGGCFYFPFDPNESPDGESGAGGPSSSSSGMGGAGGAGGQGGAPPGPCTMPGEIAPCYSVGPLEPPPVLPCKTGMHTCLPGKVWGPCEGEITPTIDICATKANEACVDDPECSYFAVFSGNFGPDFDQSVSSLVIENSGQVLLGGGFIQNANFGSSMLTSGSAQSEGYVARFATDGSVLWAREIASVGFKARQVLDIAVSPMIPNTAVAAGFTTTTDGDDPQHGFVERYSYSSAPMPAVFTEIKSVGARFGRQRSRWGATEPFTSPAHPREKSSIP